MKINSNSFVRIVFLVFKTRWLFACIESFRDVVFHLIISLLYENNSKVENSKNYSKRENFKSLLNFTYIQGQGKVGIETG